MQMLGGKGESSNATPCCDFDDFGVIFILTRSLSHTFLCFSFCLSMHLPFSLDICDCPVFSHIFMALFRIKEENLHQPFLPYQKNYLVNHMESWDNNKHIIFSWVNWHMHWEMCLYLTASTHPSLTAINSNMQFHWIFCWRVEISQEVYLCEFHKSRQVGWRETSAEELPEITSEQKFKDWQPPRPTALLDSWA